MRILLASAAVLLLTGTAAAAAPADVTVTIGPELQAKAENNYGIDEVARLARDLQLQVKRSLARSGAYEDARVELVLADVRPNRPTFKQLGDTPGLSFESFSVGGAAIDGRIVTADGAVKPVSYKWYETDIRQAAAHWTWSDAVWTFDRFANRLARRDTLASR
jgi:hypothetical protein